MNLDSVVEARIHPAIGIARVGNAESGENGPSYFIGPEVPNRVPPPKGGYRDTQGRLKRQAARFRIYGYDRAGNVVGELTDKHAQIEWHAEVANLKAAWYNFDFTFDLPESAGMSSARRNVLVQGSDRENLAIRPTARSVDSKGCSARFDDGKFYHENVYLGEMRYEKAGRLLFLPGHGKSGSVPAGLKLPNTNNTTNNNGWYDDICDGPVWATVRLLGGRHLPVTSAWIITAPPNYAPDLVATQTLYDVIVDALDREKRKNDTPSFSKDILPIFRQLDDAQWVNGGFAALFGWRGLNDFTRADLLAKLAADPGKDDPFKELRRLVFFNFRDPVSTNFEPHLWPPLYGDWQPDSGPLTAKSMLAITQLSYALLKTWSEGHFVADYNPAAKLPESLDEVAVTLQPQTLDHAALHFCVGGPFHPGPETPWLLRQASFYQKESRFRLRRRRAGLPSPDYGEFLTTDKSMADGGPLADAGPGDLTKWLGIPWQADAIGCGAGFPDSRYPDDPLIPAFWPARLPNSVLTQQNYSVIAHPKSTEMQRWQAFQSRENWWANFPTGAAEYPYMVNHFHELGLLEKRKSKLGPDFPEVMYVSTPPAPGNKAKAVRKAKKRKQ